MYCTNCGTWNPDEARSCSQCGNPMPMVTAGGAGGMGQEGAAPLMIPNHLVEAILVTLCCCVPFGIPAIVYGAQVRPKVAAGTFRGLSTLRGRRRCGPGSGSGWVGLGRSCICWR